MNSIPWNSVSIRIPSGLGWASLLLPVPVLLLGKRSGSLTGCRPSFLDLANFPASPLVEGNSLGSGLPRFDQSLESIILLAFRLSELPQVDRETQMGAGTM